MAKTLKQQTETTDADDHVFKALANADRRRILDVIQVEPQTTGALCDALPHLDRCTVMLHLRTLEAADLIISKKKGRCRWNYLNVVPIQRVYQRWIKTYAQPAAALLSRPADGAGRGLRRTPLPFSRVGGDNVRLVKFRRVN